MGRVPPIGCFIAALAALGVAMLLPAAASAKKTPGKASAAAAKQRSVKFGKRALRSGMRGKDIRKLQRLLTRLGYPITVDGAFGKTTRQSVKKLERTRRWPVDGVVSKKDAKRIKKLANARTSVYYNYGLNSPYLTLKAQRAGSATVTVTATGGGVADLSTSFDSASEQQTVTWNGITASGTYAPDGTYQLNLADPGKAGASVAGGVTKPFLLRNNAFPVVGDHSFGGAGSRFGAPRSGHIHQGQDVAAACGARLVVAEGGVLSVNSYQASGAGYYVVIHGAITGTDYVYMHLKKPSWAPVGTTVYTNQQIGKVGNTGSSSGCHLHFERWTAPGWYAGGAPYDPLAELVYWDTYS